MGRTFLTVINKTLHLGLRISLDVFPELALEHRRENPNTPEVERLGMDLAQANFPPNETTTFVKAVCDWGGYSGVWGRVLKNNEDTRICAAMRDASSFMADGDLAGALSHVNQLHGLGELSFASKHLRFMRPDLCAVYDSILRDALPYTFDARGYVELCADCKEIADILGRTGIKNPTRDAGTWLIADAEAAVYMFVRRLRKSDGKPVAR